MVQLAPAEWLSVRFTRPLRRVLLLCLLLCPLLTSCVDYDLGIRFDSQTHGVITQTIHLSDRLLVIGEGLLDEGSPESALGAPAFQTLPERARALSGRARQVDEDTLKVTLPFSSGEQLVERFNAFYGNSQDDAESNSETAAAGLLAAFPGAPSMQAHLALSQRNYLLALRCVLTYDLSIQAPEPLGLGLGPSDTGWLNMDFHLVTPWGLAAPALVGKPPGEPPAIQGRTATWHLEAGRPHHIEVAFWIPSPVGIGAAAIALLCLTGYWIKYGLISPRVSSQSLTNIANR
ncbi:MAG: DUF3153 domain-containing protein [Cyanobacteria bacterium J06623_5]